MVRGHPGPLAQRHGLVSENVFLAAPSSTQYVLCVLDALPGPSLEGLALLSIVLETLRQAAAQAYTRSTAAGSGSMGPRLRPSFGRGHLRRWL